MSKPSIRWIIALILIIFTMLQIGLFYLFSRAQLEQYSSGGVIELNTAQRLLNVQFALLVAMTLLGLLVLLFLLQFFVFRRLRRLVAATQAFANGDFSARVDVTTHNELGILSAAFNDMAQRIAATYETSKTQLSDKESRLSAIVNTTVDGIIVTTANGIIETFNPAAERIFGYRAAEVLGQGFSMLTRTQGTGLQQGLTSTKRETHGVRKDGTVFPMDMALSAVTYGDRHLFTIIVRDITERKRAEEALRHSAQRLEGLRAIDEAILRAQSLEEVANAALQYIRTLIPCERAAVSKFDKVKNEAIQLVLTNDDKTKTLPLSITSGNTALLISLKKMGYLYIEDMETALDHLKSFEALFEEKDIRSILIIPLIVENEVVGILSLGSRAPRFFTGEHIGIAREIAAQVAIGLRQIILYEHVIHHAEELGQRVLERTSEVQTFKTLVDRSHDGIIISDATSIVIIYANKAAHVLLGYDPESEELIGMDTRNLWMPEDTIMRDVAVAHVRGGGWNGDIRQRRKDGTPVDVNVSAALIYNVQNQPFMGITLRDMTERNLKEKTLRSLSNFQQAILNSAKVAIISTDLYGNITSFNPSAEQMLGYSASDVIGKLTPVAWLDTAELAAHAANISRGLEITLQPGVEALFAEASLGHSTEGEWTLIRQDGSQFPALLSITAIRDEVGGISGFLGVATDITERKQAQELLIKSRDFYLTLFENFPALIWRSRADTLCDYFNQTWLDFTGRSIEQELDLGWTENIHPDDHDHVLKTYLASFEACQPMNIEYRLRHHSGEYRWMVDTGNPFNDLDGNFAGFIGACIDISERKQVEEALLAALEKERELGELKSRFVSMASHEFRTPLATILATADALGAYRKKMDDEQIERRIDKIRTQVDHLRRIMDDVLQLARMQAGKNEFKPTVVDFDEFCRDILDEFQSRPDIKHRLIYTCSERPLPIAIDPKLMRNILANLVSNAIKYSPDSASVYITIRRDNGTVTLRVRDEGIGIPEEDHKHLFEAFHRAVNVGTISGTGLGLSIAKQSVDSHGGTITCESEVGIGTTFTVTLPALSQEP